MTRKSRSALEALKKDELKAKFPNVKFKSRMRKEEMIDEILKEERPTAKSKAVKSNRNEYK